MAERLPAKVIQRLSLYHCISRDCLERGAETVSSARIAALLGLDGSQVRKDMALCGMQGKSKVGYDVAELKGRIERLLGFERRKDAFIVGAGNLGLALAKYNDSKDYGLDVLALFDVDERKVGTSIAGKRVLCLAELEAFAKRTGVEIAILTVPASAAQEVAERLVRGEVKYIWNFTTTVLDVPASVKVCNENLMGNFLDFTNNL